MKKHLIIFSVIGLVTLAVINLSDLKAQVPFPGGGSGGGSSSSGSSDFAALTAPPSSGWTWENQGTSSVTNLTNFLHFEFANNAASFRTYFRTAPATPYTVTALIRYQLWNVLSGPTLTGDVGVGICFRDAASKLIEFYVFTAAANSTTRSLNLEKWTAVTTFSAAYTDIGPNNAILNVANNSGLIWLREADNGTNLIWSVSIDGQNWQQFDTRLRTDFLLSGPTQIGIAARSTGATDNGSVANLLSWSVQ